MRLYKSEEERYLCEEILLLEAVIQVEECMVWIEMETLLAKFLLKIKGYHHLRQ